MARGRLPADVVGLGIAGTCGVGNPLGVPGGPSEPRSASFS